MLQFWENLICSTDLLPYTSWCIQSCNYQIKSYVFVPFLNLLRFPHTYAQNHIISCCMLSYPLKMRIGRNDRSFLFVCVCVGGCSLLSIKPFLSYKFLNFRSILINSVVFGHQEMADLRFLMYLRFIFRFIPLNGIKFSIKDLKIYQIFVCCLFLDFLVYLRFPRSDGEYFCFFLKIFRDLGDIFGMGGPETLDDTMI